MTERLPRRLVGVLRQRWRLLAHLPDAGHGLLVWLLIAHVVSACVVAATAVTIGRLLDHALVSSGVGDMLLPLGLAAVLVLAGQCVEIAREPLDLLAARRIDGELRARLRRRVAEPAGIAHLDSISYSTAVARVSERGGWRTRTPGTGAVGQLLLTGRLIGAVLCAGVVGWYAPVLAVWLLAGTLLMRGVIRRQWIRLSAVRDAHAGARRRMEYWADTLTDSPAAKEIRLFGLGTWLTERHGVQALDCLGEIWRQRRDVLRRQWWTFLLALATGFTALYFPASALLAGELGVGELITMVLATWGIFAAGAMGHEAFDIEYATGAIRAFDELGQHESARPDTGRGTVLAFREPPHVRFENVGFGYPGAARPVLNGLNLDIRPAEVLAVVGRNGVGKTTLLKLLAGLRCPSEGRITLDGADLTSVDLDSWRNTVTALFQDFLQYPLTVRDNVALGAPEVDADDQAIHAALTAAGAREFVERLPDGLDTVLIREHTGGVDLSGGQWQRIAIARALFAVAHGRRVLILDEPTAHLDVKAEVEFYDRVVSSVSGVTIILISHRLSTVRRADRIVVLDDGQVTESGSHAELMDRAGGYASLYRLQADRFVGTGVDGASP